MAENSKRKRPKPWKTVIINGKRKYIFGELLEKDQSKVRAQAEASSTNVACENQLRSASAIVDINSPSSPIASNTTDCHSQATLPDNLNELNQLQRSQLDDESGPYDMPISQTVEVSSEVAYATELSRLEMVTVVNNCTFVFPDFNIESKQIKVICLYVAVNHY